MEHIASLFAFFPFWREGAEGKVWHCAGVSFFRNVPGHGFLEGTLETEAGAEGSLEPSISRGTRGYTLIL